jgi:hypothetical protein
MDNEFEKKIALRIKTFVLASLIANNSIDKTRLKDREYVLSEIKKNSHLIEESNIQITSFGQFRESIISEIVANRVMSAVVLTGVCFEHILNTFYQELLPVEYDMDAKEVLQVINRLTIPDKIGWFLKIVCGCEISPELRDNVMQINSFRNEIVHFKAIPQPLDESNPGSYEKLKAKLQNINMDYLANLTQDLEEELNEILDIINPSYKEAETICRELF